MTSGLEDTLRQHRHLAALHVDHAQPDVRGGRQGEADAPDAPQGVRLHRPKLEVCDRTLAHPGRLADHERGVAQVRPHVAGGVARHGLEEGVVRRGSRHQPVRTSPCSGRPWRSSRTPRPRPRATGRGPRGPRPRCRARSSRSVRVMPTVAIAPPTGASTCMAGGAVSAKTAVTVRCAIISSVSGFPVVAVSPLQPVKAQPESGTALTVTLVPYAVAGLVGCARHGAAARRGRRQREQVRREVRADGAVRTHARERVARVAAHRDPVHLHVEDVVARCRMDREGLARTLGHGHRAGRDDAPARARRGRDDPPVDGEIDVAGVAGLVPRGVARPGAHARGRGRRVGYGPRVAARVREPAWR